jgi:hypothetical protein
MRQSGGFCFRSVPVKLSLLLLTVLLAGCVTEVSHPTKSESEMREDIRLCRRAADHKYWMEPLAALYKTYDCLEAKGYRREQDDLSGRVERATAEGPAQPKAPAKPCRVPCPRHH